MLPRIAHLLEKAHVDFMRAASTEDLVYVHWYQERWQKSFIYVSKSMGEVPKRL